MSILFSRRCEYAIQAVMYLSLNVDHAKMSIRELTKKLSIPHPFLAKILQDLTRKGLLESQKGVKGGFTLTRAPHEITLLQIIEAVDGDSFIHNCVLGFERCDENNPCALHDHWKVFRDTTVNMLASRSISQMAHDTKKPQFIL
jgi:Rrf2 family protein